MAVGELFIGALITVLVQKLASGYLIKLARSAGIYSELSKWTDTLTQIHAVLVDAGQKHIKEESVQLWLNKLQHLAYEIDDVLDDLATEAMRHQWDKKFDASTINNMSKVLKFIPNKFHALKYGHKMSSKLDGITDKLCKLVEQKKLLGLNDNVESSYRASRQLEETSSLVGESKVIGREGDKEALLGKLLGSESSSSRIQNVSVVSIVGLGGIGKTTLAQLLYNDKEVKKHFELMAWVCISDEFDVSNISKAIFQAVGGGNQDFASLNLLQEALKEKFSKKRFLIVLDDVWNENNKKWELLQRPFTEGAPGSKILVTTRKTKVASAMDSVQTYPLQLLPNEEALSLFAQHALGHQNFDVNRILKLHGEDIVKKCGKLPLALRTLGRVFRTKSNVEEWEEILNSEIWYLDKGNEILPALKLSYYDLPPDLKQMFAYCCLFPKDHMFDKDELVLLWMAEGFLYKSNEKKSMESSGRECFEELVSRSFFQHSNSDKSRYTMHDLINDLARSVAGEFFFMLEDKMGVYDRNEAFEKLHHISFIHERYAPYRNFKALKRSRCLRTFLAKPITGLGSWNKLYLSNMVLVKLLPQVQFLRVFSLDNCSIKEVPESIGSLKHLRYLNFSNTSIKCLPEQVGDLLNLQSLLLSGCDKLYTLPNSIVKLINLRHLDITDTPELNDMPLGFGGLTGLQTLSKVIIGGSGKFRISNLKDFLHLHGQLSIEGLHKVKNAGHANEANLQQKKGIYDLELKWSYVFDGSRNELTEYEVLESLRPFEKLRSLKILYYGGTKFPNWVGDPAFICLTHLTLSGCKIPKLRLFPEGCLVHLTRLKIWGCDNIESIPDNGYGFLPFLCLRELCIFNCKNLKSIPHEHLQSLASLEEMWFADCPSLDFPFLCCLWPPNLSFLWIGGLKKGISEWGLQNFPTSLVTLRLIGGENSEGMVSFGAKADEEEDISSFLLPSSLTKLHLWGFKELESVSEGLQHLTCLQHLGIEYCPKLRDLPETLLPSLSRLTMSNCSLRLRKKCSRKGKYWPIISQIPSLQID